MDSIDNLRKSTEKLFDTINFDDLNDRWIDEVIDNEFTDAVENDITIGFLFINDAVETLTKLTEICQYWTGISVENYEDVSHSLNTSSQEEVLWAVLDEMDLNVKHILGLIYLLSFRAVKSTSSFEEKECGIASARLYFNCLRVPGSGAYNVFHPNLFKLCVDCLPAPDFTNDKGPMTLKDFDKLTAIYSSTLMTLISQLKDFYLGDDSSTVEHLIKKLSEICACEVQNLIKFNINFEDVCERELQKRNKNTFIIALLAYKSFLSLLETNLNGDQDHNYMIILSHLNRHILCLKARKSQTISHKFQVIKDNAICFFIHNLATQEFASAVTLKALKHLCLGVIDKAEFRSSVSAAVVSILVQLKIEHIVEMIKWLLLLIDSADTKDRVFALEVLGQLLNNPFQANNADVPDPMKVYLTEVPIIFAILTRCDDTSPVVRTKALTVVSQNMQCILQFLNNNKDQETFEIEILDEFCEQDIDVNGNHRFFWYNLRSLRERLDEIASILQRRVEDNNVTARKAALIALESLIAFDPTYLTTENLKYFAFSVKDANIVVRKQMMQSLSVILNAYPDHVETQVCWLKCILLMVQDPENSVQIKAIAELKEQFLEHVYSSSDSDRKGAFRLLKLLASGEFLAHHRYLQKAFSIWNKERKFIPQDADSLENYFDTEWEESVLFYLSNFTIYCSLPVKMSRLCVEKFEKLQTTRTFPTYMDYMLKVLNHISKGLASDQLLIIKNIISNSLESFEVPVEWIPLYIEILYKTHRHLSTEADFSKFSTNLIQECENRLLEIKEAHSFPECPSEELLTKYFCVMKELCQQDSSKLSKNVMSLLKVFSACEVPSPVLSRILTPTLRAHAFAALGKICLQDEILAKDLLNSYASELLISKHDVIRNNLVVILIEMCKRYTSFADKYVPLISLCFKDRLYLIRYQTIVLLVNLLQEGYIKWRGPLFFCLLSTLNDKKDEIQELGRYSLSQLLQDKKKTLFSEHFVDSIFVFNGFDPPDNETLSQIVKELDRFALEGEHKREERMLLYKFLLNSMDMKERAYLVKSVCEILMNIAEYIYPLNATTECIIRDCFAILICKEIRALNVDQFSDDIDDFEEKDFIKTELDTRRIVIVEPVIPVIAALQNSFSDPLMDLVQDIICFLKELLHDYKDEMKEILSVDKVLVTLMMHDKRSEDVKSKLTKPSSSNNQSKDGTEDSFTLAGIQTMMNDVIGDKENDKGGMNGDSGPSSGSFQTRTYNIVTATASEARDIHRFASTPRVVLTAVKVPKASNGMNLSAIEPSEAMMLDSDEDSV